MPACGSRAAPHQRRQDPIGYSVCESLRVSRHRVVQHQVLHLGELNTTQLDSCQHSIEVLHEGSAPSTAPGERRAGAFAATLWPTSGQLTEAEAAFGPLKSEVKVRPIWH